VLTRATPQRFRDRPKQLMLNRNKPNSITLADSKLV